MITVVAGVPARPIGARPEQSVGCQLEYPLPLFE